LVGVECWQAAVPAAVVWRNRRKESTNMSVAKISEITSTSKTSFDDAVADGIKRASKTIRGITGAWVADQEVVVKSGKVV
jgi:flavin-binding protein dodecin